MLISRQNIDVHFEHTGFMTVSTENATLPKSTKSRNSDSSVSCSTNSNRDFELLCTCTEEFEFLDFVDFGGVAFSVESVIPLGIQKHAHTPSHNYTKSGADIHADRDADTDIHALVCVCCVRVCACVCVCVRLYIQSRDCVFLESVTPPPPPPLSSWSTAIESVGVSNWRISLYDLKGNEYMCVVIKIYITTRRYLRNTYRMAKTHRMPDFYRTFSAKEPYH